MGCGLFDRAENAAGGLRGTLGEGAGSEREGDRRAEEDRRRDRGRARKEVRAARRTEDGARSAAAEGGAEVSALAVLHQDENDHDHSGDDLQNEGNAEQEMHFGSTL